MAQILPEVAEITVTVTCPVGGGAKTCASTRTARVHAAGESLAERTGAVMADLTGDVLRFVRQVATDPLADGGS